MKKSQLNSLAHSLCGHLLSRNNDIGGYWGVGVLCAASRKQSNSTFRFRIVPGESIVIGGQTLGASELVTAKLTRFKLDSIEGQMTFGKTDRFADGTQRYACTIAVAVTHSGRTGISMAHAACWMHDPSRERRRLVGGLA